MVASATRADRAAFGHQLQQSPSCQGGDRVQIEGSCLLAVAGGREDPVTVKVDGLIEQQADGGSTGHGATAPGIKPCDLLRREADGEGGTERHGIVGCLPSVAESVTLGGHCAPTCPSTAFTKSHTSVRGDVARLTPHSFKTKQTCGSDSRNLIQIVNC